MEPLPLLLPVSWTLAPGYDLIEENYFIYALLLLLCQLSRIEHKTHPFHEIITLSLTLITEFHRLKFFYLK